MHLIVQAFGDPPKTYALGKPLAMYMRGTEVDRAYQAGDMGPVKEWCKKARDTGANIGVGSHKPEVIQMAEGEGWDVDFYAGCAYNVTHTAEEWRKMLGGELPEMPTEVYIERSCADVQGAAADPAYMILAAGRVLERDLDRAFQTAFESIKSGDAIVVGLFPRIKDQVCENVERVHRILTRT